MTLRVRLKGQSTEVDAADVAKDHLERGWSPIPVPYKQKGPNIRGWQKLRITEGNVEEHFDRKRMNIGVLLGSASNGLTDVDLDSREAVALASELLPKTGAIFGRESKAASHWLYTTDLCDTQAQPIFKYDEPKVLAHDGEPATLVELRIGAGGKGVQTIFPGSVHPSGERVKWAEDGKPRQIAGATLQVAVASIAAGALLARNYPNGGTRHEAALVLGGFFARVPGMDASDVEKFVRAVAQAAGDEEADERGRSAAGAVDRLKNGEPTPGLPRMREVWGEVVADTVAQWLGIAAEVVSDDNEQIDQLAMLSELDYDRQRKAAADRMGVQVKTLDKVVSQRRRHLLEASSLVFLKDVEPWDEPVNADELLHEVADMFYRHVVLPEQAEIALALWVLHAHAHEAPRHSPILFISSPTKRCGKTQLLSTLNMVVPRPLPAANVTPATIFRAIPMYHPTMLIDEADTFVTDNSELRGVLNSGHVRKTAFVLRCVGDAMTPTLFSTWAPKAVAAIGRIPSTLEDRSIKILLERKAPGESVEPLPNNEDAYLDIHRKCARWAKDNHEALQAAKPTIPKKLNDRAKDNWRPLLAIADAAKGDWPDLARKAARELSGVDDDETWAIQLLEDLRRLFEEVDDRNMSSAEIVAKLIEMEDRPWPEFKRGKSITTSQLAKLLTPFNVRPRQVRISGRRANGYMREWFEEAFGRYVPLPRAPSDISDKAMKSKS